MLFCFSLAQLVTDVSGGDRKLPGSIPGTVELTVSGVLSLVKNNAKMDAFCVIFAIYLVWYIKGSVQPTLRAILLYISFESSLSIHFC